MMGLKSKDFCLFAFYLLVLPALALSQSTQSKLRASRDTYSPVMEVLGPSRTPATDAQLEELAKLPIEAVWAALQQHGYTRCFVSGLSSTQPERKLVGRALTMRYLPVRPDLVEAVRTLAKEGDWDPQFNVRAGEDAKPGDVLVVELGGMVEASTFMGDVTATGIKARGARGAVIDGGLRDLAEVRKIDDFPVYYRGAHASAMAAQIGVEWNVPVRIGDVTVLPGDVVIGDISGVLFFPPHLAQQVIDWAKKKVHEEDFQREQMRGTRYRARDIYPRMSPELQREYEEHKKRRP